MLILTDMKKELKLILLLIQKWVMNITFGSTYPVQCGVSHMVKLCIKQHLTY